MQFALHLLRLVRALTRDRTLLALENLALRQQLAVFQRNVERPSVNDRDAIYGDLVKKRIASLGTKEVVSAEQSPWQNPFAERVTGSIRRECTDHLVPLNETHLRKLLSEYVAYYNRSRCHQSLDGNSPEPRPVDHGEGSVYAIPHVGGSHHEYRRAG